MTTEYRGFQIEQSETGYVIKKYGTQYTTAATYFGCQCWIDEFLQP